MPVQDPFGPTVWTALPGNTNDASAGWAAGMTNLGRALFPDPNTLAEARYRGAQTQLLNTQATARSNLANILSNPNAAADPNNRAQIYSYISQLPADEQQSWHNNLAGVLQNTNMGQQQKDVYTAGAGYVPAENTPSGFNAKLQNQLDVAHVGAGATVQAATIGAGATLGAAQTAQQGENTRFFGNPDVTVMTPTGPQLTTRGTAAQGGYTPGNYQNPADAATVQTTLEQLGIKPKTPPSQGTSPPPAATQPQSSSAQPPTSAPPAASDGSPKPGFGTALGANVSKTQTSNLPKEGMDTALLDLADKTFGKTWPGGTPYQVGPGIAGAIYNRANQLFLNRGNQQTFQNATGAVTQAWNELVMPNRANINQAWRGPGDSPIADYKPGFVPQPPEAPTTPLPSTARPVQAPPNTQVPMPPSGSRAIPPPATPPAVPQQQPPPARRQRAAGPAPATAPTAPKTVTSMSQIPPENYKAGQLVVHGRMFTGGNPTDINSWRPATQAELSAANKGGYNYQ